MKVLIIDGYVDEPACLGVSPYISPYPRYIAGALRDRRVPQRDIHYVTIDGIRDHPRQSEKLIRNAEIVIVIAGSTVPGKYLNATPIKPDEIQSILRTASGQKILGGPIHFGFAEEGGTIAKEFRAGDESITLVKGDIEAFIYDMVGKNQTILDPETINPRLRSIDEVGRWSIAGAFIVRQHPRYPHIICEIETYRGCGRKTHCSFCTENFYGNSEYRDVQNVISEIKNLYDYGALHFRIGRQPDLLGFHAIDTGNTVPEPQPQVIELLYKGIRASAPEIKTLHMDNVNPATIKEYPEKSLEIIKTIVRYHTPGDVAALGMESADPAVIKANNLKAYPEDVLEAIKMINDTGKKRGYNGLPEFLPGINFVHGLPGETRRTYELNYRFLQDILDKEYLLRRINIRQVMAFPGTEIYREKKSINKNRKLFLKYKELIRKNIDLPMLKKVIPGGTVITDLICEHSEKGYTLARQPASYPLIVKIPGEFPEGKMMDVAISGHRSRSINGIPCPLNINRAPFKVIKEIPGIGKKQAMDIAANAPYEDKNDFLTRINNGESIISYLEFE